MICTILVVGGAELLVVVDKLIVVEVESTMLLELDLLTLVA